MSSGSKGTGYVHPTRQSSLEATDGVAQLLESFSREKSKGKMRACVKSMQGKLDAAYSAQELTEFGPDPADTAELQGDSPRSGAVSEADMTPRLSTRSEIVATESQLPSRPAGLPGLLHEGRDRVDKLLGKLHTEDRLLDLAYLDQWYQKRKVEARRSQRHFDKMLRDKFASNLEGKEEDVVAERVKGSAPEALAKSSMQECSKLEEFAKSIRSRVGQDIVWQEALEKVKDEYERDLTESIGKEVVQEMQEKVRRLKEEIGFLEEPQEAETGQDARPDGIVAMQQRLEEKKSALQKINQEASAAEKKSAALTRYALLVSGGIDHTDPRDKNAKGPGDQWLAEYVLQMRSRIWRERRHEVLARCPQTPALERSTLDERDMAHDIAEKVTEREADITNLIAEVQTTQRHLTATKAQGNLMYASVAEAKAELERALAEHRSSTEILNQLQKRLIRQQRKESKLHGAIAELDRLTGESITNLHTQCVKEVFPEEPLMAPSSWAAALDRDWNEAKGHCNFFAQVMFGEDAVEDETVTMMDVEVLKERDQRLWEVLLAFETTLCPPKKAPRTPTSPGRSPTSPASSSQRLLATSWHLPEARGRTQKLDVPADGVDALQHFYALCPEQDPAAWRRWNDSCEGYQSLVHGVEQLVFRLENPHEENPQDSSTDS